MAREDWRVETHPIHILSAGHLSEGEQPLAREAIPSSHLLITASKSNLHIIIIHVFTHAKPEAATAVASGKSVCGIIIIVVIIIIIIITSTLVEGGGGICMVAKCPFVIIH